MGLATKHVANGILAMEYATIKIKEPGNLNTYIPIFAITAEVMTSKKKRPLYYLIRYFRNRLKWINFILL